MASRSVAPGAALLRASRVFAIPPALPRPTGDYAAASGGFSSDTATLPHPIHQSLTTFQSSLERGDWGLKRSLPLRSTTKTSTPLIKVEAMDTFEQITEFASAADHTLSLQKWQEMGIPITTPKPKRESNFEGTGSGRSVFEDDLDSTTHGTNAHVKDTTRWKFKGPWLAGQTEGEFNNYVQKEVRKRKTEFRKFLRRECAAAINKETQQRKNLKKDAEAEATEAQSILGPQDITDEQLSTYIQTLREDRAELFKQIRTFLDLPPSPVRKDAGLFNVAELMFSSSLLPNSGPDGQSEAASMSPYAESGPPKTHPSAGLSYGRTSSKLFNHPVYGPQKYSPPVQARVVTPSRSATGTLGAALGVGGFVTRLPASEQLGQAGYYSRDKAMKSSPLVGLSKVDPDNKAGAKLYVQPTRATVDAQGKVVLQVSLADPVAVAVKEDKVDELPVAEPPRRISPLGATRSIRIEGQNNSSGSLYGI
ncbi:uncharacterized protein BP5553_04321 [Venustampulla echinocandica]|uniref:Uncharacterized protein n=1 Tax=Venustampulla echinocandica TaxID=2656787 RepID=A0A370TWT0_9HELO|nr:uncharacterized protein BP5553_04321 [Venustampulla echinocandica]RDL39981.1 hypothetical protein BP5553_04321 [Venustampulla echinocandica]